MIDVAPIDAGPTGAHVLDVSPAEYHRDPLASPSLSSSIANELLLRSPLHAWSAHPRLGGEPSEGTKATDVGTIVHRLVLGKGSDYEVLPYQNYLTKRAKRARELARLEGRVPVLAHVFSAAESTAESVRDALERVDVALDGESEVAIAWPEIGKDGSTVWCRALLDHLQLERARVVDVKSITSAHPEACMRSVIKFGYDVQATAYTRAVTALRPDLDGRLDYLLAFVETTPPFASYVARLDGVFRARGEQRWARAVDTWARCLATNEWPGYGDGIGRLEAPGWLLAQMQMEEA